MSEDLRPGADRCTKCSSCDAACPVAAVDDSFPGPKFQGPEQWRLTQTQDADIDPTITKCSNCMRCAGACPTDVPLVEMHTTARAAHLEGVSRLSREYVRAKMLGNYGRLAGLASRFPRLSNAVMGTGLGRWFAEKTLGITAEREFPAFADETFREWWDDRGGAAVTNPDKRVAYFHGDYANYNTPEVGRAMVAVFEHFGYEVAVPDQRCSGTPMFANGLLEDARRAATHNVETFHALVEEGYDVVCTCTSCSMALRLEYPALFEVPGTEEVAAHTWDALEYLRVHEDLEAALDSTAGPDRTLTYHAPCHARVQGLGSQTPELLEAAESVTVDDAGDSCSGISGTYGWKSEHYDTSMAVGEPMFEHMEAGPAREGITECPTCAMQMEHGTGYDVSHTIEVLAEQLSGVE